MQALPYTKELNITTYFNRFEKYVLVRAMRRIQSRCPLPCPRVKRLFKMSFDPQTPIIIKLEVWCWNWNIDRL